MGINYSEINASLAFPKGTPPTQERQAKKRAVQSEEDKARSAVWARDKGRDRATGKPLKRNSANPDERGEWCHLKGRRVKPEWKTDPRRQILLSATNHQLSDGRGGYLLKILNPKTLAPATDGNAPILFIRYNPKGVELWRRIS